MKATINVPRNAKVFLLEDSEERVVWFKTKFPNLVHAETAASAIDILVHSDFDVVFLDHDLGLLDYQGYTAHGAGTGKDVARYLSGRNWLGKNAVIHSWNPEGAAAMKDLLTGAIAIPFGQFEINIEGTK